MLQTLKWKLLCYYLFIMVVLSSVVNSLEFKISEEKFETWTKSVQGKSGTCCLILKYSPLLWRFWCAVNAFSSFEISSLSFAISILWSSSSFAILVSSHWFSENWSVRTLLLLKNHGTKIEINLTLAYIFVYCCLNIFGI